MAGIRWKRAAGPVVAAVMVGSAVVGIDQVNDRAEAPQEPPPAAVAPTEPSPTHPQRPPATTDEPRTLTRVRPLLRKRRIILRGTNQARSLVGKPNLRMKRPLNRVAQRWSRTMANAGSMSHNPRVGSQIPDGWSTWAENVAYGYTVRTVVGAWMKSPGHRENILRDVNRIGIGIARSDNGTRYYTQVFAQY